MKPNPKLYLKRYGWGILYPRLNFLQSGLAGERVWLFVSDQPHGDDAEHEQWIRESEILRLFKKIGTGKHRGRPYEGATPKRRDRYIGGMWAPGQPNSTAEPIVNYEPWPNPMAFMKWARHHTKGGRTDSERYMDRRVWVDIFKNNPELSHRDTNVKEAAWANAFGEHGNGMPRRAIYPGRATDEGVLQRVRDDNKCQECGASLRDKRKDAKFCDQVCKKRFSRKVVPDNRAR